jgi:CBS domain-containing protein
MSDFHPIPVRSPQALHATLVQGEAHAELDDPASDVFTDLRIAPSVVVPAAESLADTRRLMQYAGVRMAFVVDGSGAVIGSVTAADLQGERPLLATRERFVPHHDLTVVDVMTRVSDWATFDIERLKKAHIGDIVATMRATGQRYLIVTETSAEAGGPRLLVRGLFSANRVERALGVPIDGELRSRSFADLAAALAHD